MTFFDSLSISASGLSAQRIRMNLIASNMANINTTRTATGEPYKRKEAVFEAVQKNLSFETVLNEEIATPKEGVKVAQIVEDEDVFIEKYDPQHPDADEKGFIRLPNINMVEEMVNMISASRSFEANATAIKTTKQLASAALDIGKNA